MNDTFADERSAYGLPVRLVLDGAIVKNVEEHLADYDLGGRPLFRETADRETISAGTWSIYCGLDAPSIERCVSAARQAGRE